MVGRTGTHDFGRAAEDQEISTSAYFANGLRGNSDAYFPGAPPEHGGQMFWCEGGDRGSRIENLAGAKLVQLKISMDTKFERAEDVNDWFTAARASCRGPGVHAILFTSHAMFFSGKPDPLRSLEGGAFDELDSHLRWVRQTYPDIEFATASEAVLEFLDYYTPALEAHVEPFVRGGEPGLGEFEFEVRLLGLGIRLDDEHPREVRISAPHCFSADDLAEIQVIQDGNVIATTRRFDPAQQPSILVTIDRRGPLRLGLQLKPEAIEAALSWFSDGGSVTFYDPRETKGSDLLYVGSPRSGETGTRFSGGSIKLLMNPIAGNPEPLGRRTHPLSAYAIGAALRTAFERVGHRDLVRLKVRWLRIVDPNSDFVVRTEIKSDKVGFEIEDDSGLKLVEGELELRSP